MSSDVHTLPHLDAYRVMSERELKVARYIAVSYVDSKLIDWATYDRHRMIIDACLDIVRREEELAFEQLKLDRANARLDALLSGKLTEDAAFVLRFIADQESREQLLFHNTFTVDRHLLIYTELVDPGYAEIVHKPGRAFDTDCWFYIVTPQGLSVLKDAQS